MSFRYCILFFVILSLTILISSAWGSGIALYEQGTPDVGRANAGTAAIASDASTAGRNPAGMTRLERSQLMATLQPLLMRVKFDVSSGTTTSGGNGSDAGDLIMSAGFFYVHNVTENFKIGIASGSYFGAGLDYGNNWVGRYYVQTC